MLFEMDLIGYSACVMYDVINIVLVSLNQLHININLYVFYPCCFQEVCFICRLTTI